MVVQHEDGVMSCTPFHVRFAKVHTTSSKERVIRLRVNGRIVPLCMKLGVAGEAFFVERVHNPLRRDLVTSPLSSPLREGQEGGAEDGGGGGGGRQWEESAGQDDWESRQLRNYQLLSDLSSDDEAASYRESNGVPPSSSASAARLLGGVGGDSSRSQSPRQPSLPAPLLQAAVPVSGPAGSGGKAEGDNASAATGTAGSGGKAEGDNASAAVGDTTNDSINDSGSGSLSAGGNSNVGAVSDCSNSRASSLRQQEAPTPAAEAAAPVAAAAAAGPATTAATAESPGASAAEAVASGGGGNGLRIDGVSTPAARPPAASTVPADVAAAGRRREGSREWSDGDGDEEDNADGSDEADGNGGGGGGGRRGSGGSGGGEREGREGGADGSGRGEAREGEEGSWWWSWTWGALPVRRKPKSTRRKHHGRRTRGRRGTGELAESPSAAAAAQPSGAGGARTARASTGDASTAAAESAAEQQGIHKARSLQAGLGAGDRAPSPALAGLAVDGAVAWAVGEGVEESSCSSGAEGGGGGGGGGRSKVRCSAGSPGKGKVAAKHAVEGEGVADGNAGPPAVSSASTTAGDDAGKEPRFPSPSRPPPPPAEASAADGTGRIGDGGSSRNARGARSSAPPSSLSAQPSFCAAAATGRDADAGDAGSRTDASGTGATDAASSLGEEGAADAAAGATSPQAVSSRADRGGGPPPPASSPSSSSPWIGRGGSDDGNNDGDLAAAPVAAAAAVPSPPVGFGLGSDSDSSALAMKMCVTDVLVEAEEWHGGDEVVLRASPDPSEGPATGAARGAAATSHVSQIPEFSAALAPDTDGTAAAEGPAAARALSNATERDKEAVQVVSEGDHLALAHLLLRAREDSSCLPSYREGEGANVSAAAAAASSSNGPGGPSATTGTLGVVAAGAANANATTGAAPPQDEHGQADARGAVVAPVPSRQCIFPGDEESQMNQEVVAVETLSSDTEAWLTGKDGAPRIELLRDPRLLVAMEGRLMTMPEALPHLIAASVFGNSLLQPPLSRQSTTAGESRSEGGTGSGSGDDEPRDRAPSVLDGSGAEGRSSGSPRSSPVSAAAEGGGGGGGGGDAFDGRRDAGAAGAPGGDGTPTGVDLVSGGGDGAAGNGPSSDPVGGGGDGAEEAAGGYWGLSGWFGRRSGMSPPPPLGGGPAAASAGSGMVVDQRPEVAGRSAPGGVGEGGVSGAKRGGSGSSSRTGGRMAPSPLSMEIVGAGGGKRGGDGGEPDAGYVSGTDEDEDLYGKTLRPTSEQLAALRLRAGCNTVEFVVNVAGQAERVVSARAFLWGSGAKVVVSDIENTIARSGGGAGMGSFTQVVGPGVHKDVSTLFSKISANGYKILYLTNRPLADWHAKRGAAVAAAEGGGSVLPRGPVLCPPEVLFRSTSSAERRGHQEVRP
eukprot:g2220.t1